jgi:exonuclease VII small subunit
MEGSAAELGAIVDRLEEAASRLRDDSETAPARVPGREPPPPRADPAPGPERRRLAEVIDGLERANVEVRRARARLAQLEARLDGRRAA